MSYVKVSESHESLEVTPFSEWWGGDWLLTFTGLHFYPLTPNPNDVDIEDIAHALSNTCRFNGHVSTFYSVAQHCVLVSQYCVNNPLWGLMHDAAEAYLPDVATPVKKNLVGFDAIENAVLRTVAIRYGLSSRRPPMSPVRNGSAPWRSDWMLPAGRHRRATTPCPG